MIEEIIENNIELSAPVDRVKLIQEAIHSRFDYKYHIDNAFVFYWECDCFIVTKSGYGVEFEIKLTRSDFKADFKKITKHQVLQKGEGWREFWTCSKLLKFDRPHKFYYVCPENLIKLEEIPWYAGLIYYKSKHENPDWGNPDDLEVIKQAKFLHKEKLNFDKMLCSKYYNLWLRAKSMID